MSVINNALKTAQREKQRNDARGGGPSNVPVLVPLKGASAPDFSWQRAIVLGVGGAAAFAVVWFGVQRARSSDLRSMPAPPPVLITDIATSSAPRTVTTPEPQVATRNDTATVPTAAPVPASAPATAPPRTTPTSRPARSTRRPVAVAESRVAVLQSGQADSAARTAARETGRLHIAVEQPRAENVAELFAIGVAAHRIGDLVAARQAYERVLVLAPNDVDALNNMGVLLSALRDFDRAEPMLRRAVALAPRNASAWNNLGTVLRERGQTNDAIAAYQHSLSIDPQHQGARVSLAQQYLAIRSLPQARQLLEDVVTANPAAAEAQYTLGQVRELQGDKAGAVQAYSAFVRIAPPRLATHIERVRRRIDELTAKAP